MKKNTVLSLAAASLFFFAGCGNNTGHAKRPLPQAPAVEMSSSTVMDFLPDPSKYGTVSECPVNKERVVVGKGTAAVMYQGNQYYMCCPECLGQFKKNPEKYK